MISSRYAAARALEHRALRNRFCRFPQRMPTQAATADEERAGVHFIPGFRAMEQQQRVKDETSQCDSHSSLFIIAA
jgi:hypothetical protein